MLFAAYVINPLLMIALPIVLGVVLARRLGVSWRLFGVGAVTFVGSQVVHIPLNAGLSWLAPTLTAPAPGNLGAVAVTAVVLGLSAGLCEEGARYLAYRFWIKDARHWRQALMFGAGHGGTEAIILGLLAGIGTINILTLSRTDLSTLPVTPEQLATIQQQLSVALGYPWWYPLLGTLERVIAILNHLALAVLVLQAFRRSGGLAWLLAAMLWHAALDGTAVFVASQMTSETGAVLVEGVLALFALVSLGIIWALRDPGPVPPALPPVEPLPTPVGGPLAPAEPTRADLDKTRYQ
jgi:uncharacterized membrane protein YhfC